MPFKIKASCVMEDAELYEHIRLALLRGLPLMAERDLQTTSAVLVGSGPSVKGQLDSIKKERDLGNPIIAIKDAHDWLISEGVIPDYAVAVDPQEHRWNCFTKKHPAVKYMIASQCHPAMFDHLSGMDVTLWHLYIRQGQTYPPDSLLVTGGTTTGLRAITLFYSQGFRSFKLYGYDSCLSAGALRFDGKQATQQHFQIICGGKAFTTTPEMAAQANEFQNLFQCMPDMEIESFGEGIITTILAERRKYLGNNSVSFVHSGNDDMASYRYRCRIPSEQLRVPTNNLKAEVVIFSKPMPLEGPALAHARGRAQTIIADFCDDHFDQAHYWQFARLADAITVPTEGMKERIPEELQHKVRIIPDPYEYALKEPHCSGKKLLWFGHASNYDSLERVLPELESYPLRVVTNRPDCIPWSRSIMPGEFAKADIVVIPATASYKSPNRAVEAIRQGCFVVAEPHPSIKDFPGIWIGNLKEGIEWASQNLQQANERTREAQTYTENFAPERVGNAWKTLVAELSSTSAAGTRNGTDG